MIIVDSDVTIEAMVPRMTHHQQVREALSQNLEEIAITSLSYHEVSYGLRQRGERSEFLAALQVLGFSKEDAELSARIEGELVASGQPGADR